ncbi:hypothetical protein [Variovorax sp. 770b2]|jgi:hypothetical protein|uniref:hypothetical protein n=1 Tax=Variovorax sp. 770b2 TaxID=1566271 RepID=UPI0008EA8253|nr:hypothetical protein [Variovorax sp. 770b2]SFQ11257.1 hypothetical protein SAMN03159339_5574 [Variovorax sp. 770b2]
MIDPSTQLAAMIRAQFAAQFRAQAKDRPVAGRDAHATRGESGHASRASGEAAPSAPANEDAQIQQMVALRVRSLSPDDPQRQRKAFRLFLESVLMQAFGRERLDDRGFDQMVDAVLQRMEGDPQLSAALREAGDLLLADAGPGSPAIVPR